MKAAAIFTTGLVLMALLAAGLPSAHAEGWHSEQPPPPPPPEGETGVGVPVPLGHIGDIEFWAPNRGLLITSGTQAVPAGLYYYDGVSWHELATVCGGSDGRIAWAGPDDFWTISDQQIGQQIGTGGVSGQDISLCHFLDGQVVASYAEPVGVPGSYQAMDAAACSGPDDCWFGGETLPTGGPNTGAFHLHWNGRAVTALPSLENPEPQLEDPARKVADIVYQWGHFYESVQVQQSDNVPSESATQPYLLHRIVEGSTKPFVPLIPEGALSYGEGARPWELSAFRLSGGASELWALAGPIEASSAAQPTALLQGTGGGFRQVKLSDPRGTLDNASIAGLAAEPSGAAAWASVDPFGGPAERDGRALVARIAVDGAVEAQTELPEADETLGHKGSAGAIVCPASNDCWLATSLGWLFHLGGSQPRDEDPYFQTLITSRPLDASIPFVASDEAPPDDSGASTPPVLPLANEALKAEPTVPRAHEPLFAGVHSRLRGTTLLLTFTLATRSHVRLLALRHDRTVAATRKVVLRGGRHTLRLSLSRRSWPTRLDLQVKAIGAVPLASGGGSATGGPAVVTTSLRGPLGNASVAPLWSELSAGPLA